MLLDVAQLFKQYGFSNFGHKTSTRDAFCDQLRQIFNTCVAAKYSYGGKKAGLTRGRNDYLNIENTDSAETAMRRLRVAFAEHLSTPVDDIFQEDEN